MDVTRQRRQHRRACLCLLAISVLASSVDGRQERVETAPTPELVLRALTNGAYEEAERLAALWSAQNEVEQGAESLPLARSLDLLVESQLKNGKAGTKDTMALAARAVRLKEQHRGPDDPDTAMSLHNLGLAHVLRGESVAAVPDRKSTRLNSSHLVMSYAVLC